MGSTDEQPASELVADLLDTARASRARAMQEVAEAWQRAGTITRNLILMASSEIGSIERPATDLVTQLHMYILVAGPEAATSRSQPPSPLGDGTPRALGGWLTELGHNITSDSGDDPVVTAWQWLADHQAFEVGQAGARRVMRHLAGRFYHDVVEAGSFEEALQLAAGRAAAPPDLQTD